MKRWRNTPLIRLGLIALFTLPAGSVAVNHLRHIAKAKSSRTRHTNAPDRVGGHDKEAEDAHNGNDCSGTADSAHAGHAMGARPVAVGLVSATVMAPVVLYMALSDGIVAGLTLRMIDTFISIFLAVLWFNAFEQLLRTTLKGSDWPYIQEFICAMQVILLYGIAIAVAWLWRDNSLALVTFCSTGAHYIAFAGIAASGSWQEAISSLSPGDKGPILSFLVCVACLVFLFLGSGLTYKLWRHQVQSEKFNESIDELEFDILGLVASFLITQTVRHWLTGKYPAPHFIQAGSSVVREDASKHLLQEGSHPVKHRAWQRWFMFCWSVGLTLVAVLLIPRLKKLIGDGHWARVIIRNTKVILIMCVAWGYMLWGQWQFLEEWFDGDVLFGYMLFAVIATLTGLLVLVVLASLHGRAKSKEALQTQMITVTGVSLVVAWSWEHCFNLAFDVIGESYQVGYGGLVPKLVMAVGIPMVLLPTYIKHIKPRALESHCDIFSESEGDLTPRHRTGASHGPSEAEIPREAS